MPLYRMSQADPDSTLLEICRRRSRGTETQDIAKLVQQGASVNARDREFQRTALHHAIVCGNDDAFDTLLELGADVTLADSHSTTPLHDAAHGGFPVKCKQLLERGAACDVYTRLGLTPLHAAVLSGMRECVKLLAHHGGDPDFPTSEDAHYPGVTALFLAVKEEQWVVALSLIVHGCDPQRALGQPGLSSTAKSVLEFPLHLAASRDDAEACAKLLALGYDPMLTDELGRRPVQRAKTPVVADLLLAAQAAHLARLARQDMDAARKQP